VALVIVPSTFVDVPGYNLTAKSVTRGLWIVQSLAVVSLFAFACLVISFDIRIPERCTWNHSTQRGLWHYLTEEHPGLLISSATSLFIHIVLTVVSRAYFGTPVERLDGAVLRIRPSQSRTVASQCLRVVCPRGLSSLLLKVAVGVSGNIFGNLGEAEDYVIENELGRGVFGKVVQVRRESSNPARAGQRFAVKLHSGSMREAELLANIDHPFCVLLLDHFRLPKNHTFLCEDGSEVGHFSIAIRMELCTAGTLETLLARHWALHPGPERVALLREGPQRTECLRLLRMWQRFAGELTEVMACLHGQNPPIVYRDLKPDNVLLREGRDQQLHICLTDFGYAKQPNFVDELSTPAGNFLTAAPEVPRPWEAHREYTRNVDNWSLGKTLLCMLWCTYGAAGSNRRFSVVPEVALWDDEDDPRVPPYAAKLVSTLTQHDPERRGTMQEAIRSPFFTTTFQHMGEEFQPVRMPALLDAARR